jgi:hypothetical protein
LSVSRPRASRRQGESFNFYFYEQPPDRAYSVVKVGTFRVLEVLEEAADPRREMFIE